MGLVAKLVELDDIAPEIGSKELHLFDVRWYLDGRSGHEAFVQGHVKSAVYLDLDTCLCDPEVASSTRGRHPLPTPKHFEAVLTSFGATRDHRLVFYDDQGGSIAARAWWMASAIGFDAALLNGGLSAVPSDMTESGESRQTSLARLPYGSHGSSWDPNLVISEEELKVHISNGTVILLDARSKERYQGINESIDPRAGHIPSAVSAFWRNNVDDRDKFLQPEAIAANFRRLGIEPSAATEVVSSCGSGITACHNIFSLLYALDIQARLFPPSFSGWCQNSQNKVDT